jgi:hypothetical protein
MTTPTPSGRNITINPETAGAGGAEIREFAGQLRALADQMVKYQQLGLASTNTVAGQPPALRPVVEGFQNGSQSVIDELNALATRVEQMGNTIVKTANAQRDANTQGANNVGDTTTT